MVSQERLKQLMHYDPLTGVFTWLITVNARATAGKEVGSLDSDGYLRTTINRKAYKLHRLAFLYVTGEIPVEEVDHINGVRNFNAWGNLRKASNTGNRCNTRNSSRNTSGFRGVSAHRKKWRAVASLNGKYYFLGSFFTPEEASVVYEDFTLKHHGDFHRTKGVYNNGKTCRTKPI